MKKLTMLLLLICVCYTQISSSFAAVRASDPPITITGKITAKDGTPVIGATIRVKGARAGATTNSSGAFTLAAIADNAVLVISSMGYNTMEFTLKPTEKGISATPAKATDAENLQVTTGPSPFVNITLTSAVQELGESVVIAYGTVKKRDLTGSVVSIKEADITATPVNNPMEALQGKVAGMDIMRGSGAVGTNVNILLRGSRSIYGDNSPLFIVDGIQSSYDQINPSDIASIDILKDASSTAIYGSAGSNGVVIITTKKGKAGKSTVNLDVFYGRSGSPHFFKGMVGDEYTNYRKELYRTVNGEYPQDMSQIFTTEPVLDAYNKGKWIDWVGLVTNNTATQQKYHLSLSDGTGKTKVYTSFTYTKEEGILSNENLNRYALRMNLDRDMATWMKVGTNINVNYSIQNARGKNIFTKSLSALPLGDPYDAQGNINPVFVQGETTPLGDQLPNQYADNTRTTFAYMNGYLDIKPFKDLSYRSVLGVTLNSYRNGKYFGKQAVSNVIPSYAAPLAGIYNGFTYGYTWENIVTYNKTIATDHQLTLTGISSWAKNSGDYNNAIGQGQELDYYLFYNLANGTQKTGIASSYEQRQRMSFAGRINYSFRGKYLLTLTNRWDGVSHLANGHKWSAFPAAVAAWRISDESFLQGAHGWMDELKLRAGYGVTGNSGGMSAYSSQTQAFTYQVISLNGALVPNVQNGGTYSNPLISWERSYNTNIGLDLSLLKGRINMAVDVYNTDTKGLLFKRTLPVTSGLTTWASPLQMWQNIGQTNNKGIEITLSTRNIVKPAFEWSTNFSFTSNKEKIVYLPDGDVIGENLFAGHPISTHYNYKYQGIWSTSEEATATLYGAKPGFVKVATNEKFDATGTGDKGVHPYSTNDRMILGSTVPKWLLGVNNNLTFRNFDLNIFTMIRWGQTINSSLLGWYSTNDDGQPAGINYWTPENQSARYPRPGINSTTGIESLRYVDGSFIKIKTITAGYTFPSRLTNYAHISKGRIYATAYNPLVYTKNRELKGTDPETGGADTFPLFASYVFGMNITF